MKYLVLLLILSACARDGQESKNIGNFRIEKLFTNEKCSVYRFYDTGNYHYYTSCQETIQTLACGKNCYREENIKTNGIPFIVEENK